MLDFLADVFENVGDFGKSENNAFSIKLISDEIECPESLIE